MAVYETCFKLKAFAVFCLPLALVFSLPGATNSMENFSPHLSIATPIIWQSETTNLPKGFWIYKRILPHIFPASVISNAMVLASYQERGFPKPSTNDTCIFDDPDCNCECARICNFSINPESATLDFSSPDQNSFTGQIPNDKAIVIRAREYASELGIDLTKVVEKNMTSHFNTDTNGNDLTNQICGRGVNLSRQLDGFCFWGTGDNGPNAGLWIEFGSQGKIRGFSLRWPELVRYKNDQTASLQQITACIRAHKVVVIPDPADGSYFERLKNLANAKNFTITKITPYYGDGVLGETPRDGADPQFATPFAELEAVADLGNSNATLRLVAPILSSDVRRLLQ